MKRKVILVRPAVVWIVVILLISLVSGCGQPPASTSSPSAPSPQSSSPAPLKKIKISLSSPSYAFLPAKVAIDKGYFKEEGLEVDLFQLPPPNVMAALSNKEIDYTLTFSTVVDGALKGMPFKIIAAITTKPQHYLIAKPEFKSVKDLKDKVLGVSSARNTDQDVAEAIVEALGGDPKAFKIVALGAEAPRAEMLRKGKIDALAATPPWPLVLKKEGFNVLGGPDSLKAASPLSAVSTTEAKIKENPEEVKKVLRAFLRAQKFIHSDRKGTVKIMASWLNQDEATADGAYDWILPTLSSDGKAPEEGYAIAIRQRKESIKAEKEIPVTQLLDWRLLEEVQKTIK